MSGLEELTRDELIIILNQSKAVSENMQDKGTNLVITSIATVVSVVIVLVFLYVVLRLLFFFLKKMTPDKSEIEKLAKLIREDIKKSLDLKNELSNEQIKHVIRDKAKIITFSLKDKAVEVIENNSLIRNQVYIVEEVRNMIDDNIENSFQECINFGIDEFKLKSYFFNLHEIKESVVSKFDEALSEAVKKLAILEAGFDELEYRKEKLTAFEYVKNYIEKIEMQKNDYSELKRKVRITLENARKEICENLK